MVFFEYFIPIKLSISSFPGSLQQLQPQAEMSKKKDDYMAEIDETAAVERFPASSCLCMVSWKT